MVCLLMNYWVTDGYMVALANNESVSLKLKQKNANIRSINVPTIFSMHIRSAFVRYSLWKTHQSSKVPHWRKMWWKYWYFLWKDIPSNSGWANWQLTIFHIGRAVHEIILLDIRKGNTNIQIPHTQKGLPIWWMFSTRTFVELYIVSGIGRAKVVEEPPAVPVLWLLARASHLKSNWKTVCVDMQRSLTRLGRFRQ